MTTRNKFSAGVCERALWMAGEHRADYGSEWAAMTSIAPSSAVQLTRCAAGTAMRRADERDQRRLPPMTVTG